MGKFCVQCGAKLEENAAFCSKCGASAGMPEKERGKTPDKETAGKEKSGSGKRIAIISVIAAVLVFLLAVGGSAMYFLSDEYQCKRNMRLADKNYEAEAYEEALSYYGAALDLDDTLVEAYLKSADIYSKEDSYEKALKILKLGMKKNEDEESWKLLSEEYENVCLEGADFFLDSGEYEQAIDLVKEGRKQLGDDYRTLIDKMTEVYIEEADDFLGNEDYEKAVAVLKEGQEVVGDVGAATLADKEKEIQEKYLFPPADKTVAALFEVYVKNNAGPMQELLGFTSEEDVYQAFYEKGIDMKLASQLSVELVDAGITFSDDEMEELLDSYIKFLSKAECTAEIKNENDDGIFVALEVYGFSFDEMTQAMLDASERMVNSITYEDQLAFAAGETEVLSAYMQQYMKDLFDKLSELEINTEPVEVIVYCEKVSINVSGTERIVYLPSDLDSFSYDIGDAVFQ
ncbi:MAG: zinc-ribbon domain-containing protein [Lachnospiraceae bacterium]|nr:zinc-ribbon domain-containing protein [Lachnospiraceae bacterium]